MKDKFQLPHSTEPILEDNGIKIQPRHIARKGPLWNAFDNCETEISAGWLVDMAIARGKGWAPFTFEDIQSRYRLTWPHQNFTFNHLIGEFSRWGIMEGTTFHRLDVIVKIGDIYHFTNEFINRCYKSQGKPIDSQRSVHMMNARSSREARKAKRNRHVVRSTRHHLKRCRV